MPSKRRASVSSPAPCFTNKSSSSSCVPLSRGNCPSFSVLSDGDSLQFPARPRHDIPRVFPKLGVSGRHWETVGDGGRRLDGVHVQAELYNMSFSLLILHVKTWSAGFASNLLEHVLG
ncbi:hypothetical protein RRG08_047796 [Elysia crispata]|uniref:Uncharacterized protein n=1 Tax=Elysia crispata TaxID=231223 RepID=A0AAE0Y2T2_9GAST|nr:hypothetical protein RRG08_047796 [Elysia crispata]